MTKSTITRERLEWLSQISCRDDIEDIGGDEIRELASMALAAMDSEPVAEVVSIYGDPEAFGEREIRPLVGIQQMPYGTKLYRHAQPATASEPLAVTDDELNAALQLHRLKVDGHSQLSDAFRAGFRYARRTTPQPAPLVSAELLHTAASAIEDLLTTKDRTGAGVWFDLPFRLRSAANAQSPGSEPATVPGKWIPVSERMPEREVDVQVYCPDKKEQMVACLERNELEGYFRFATWRTGDGIYCQPTHWMPLPAAPQEGK